MADLHKTQAVFISFSILSTVLLQLVYPTSGNYMEVRLADLKIVKWFGLCDTATDTEGRKKGKATIKEPLKFAFLLSGDDALVSDADGPFEILGVSDGDAIKNLSVLGLLHPFDRMRFLSFYSEFKRMDSNYNVSRTKSPYSFLRQSDPGEYILLSVTLIRIAPTKSDDGATGDKAISPLVLLSATEYTAR